MALSTGAVGTALALRGADEAAPAETASEADSLDEGSLEAGAAEVGVVVDADAIVTSAAPGVVAGRADAVDGAAADPATYSVESTVGGAAAEGSDRRPGHLRLGAASRDLVGRGGDGAPAALP